MKWLALFFTFCFSPTMWAQNLKIQGAAVETIETVRKVAPHLFDDQSSLAEVDQLVRLLMELGSFEKVSAYKLANGDILIEAQTVKILSNLRVEGHRLASTSVIKDIIGLKVGEKFDRKRIIEAGEKLKDYYGEQGYFNALIEVKFLNVASSNLDVLFVIDERSPCLLESTEIDTPNLALKDQLEKRLKRLQKEPLTTPLFQKMKATIEAFLIKDRYLRASVSNPDIDYNEDRTRAKIKYVLKDPYKYDRRFVGNQQLSVFDIYRAIEQGDKSLSSGDPVIEVTEKIKQRYLSDGYAHIQVKTEVNESDHGFLHKVIVNINEGPRVKIDSIEVTGRISRPSNYYANIIRDNSSELISDGYYNRADLEIGHQNLINELRNQGYLKARIQSLRTEYINKKSQAKIKIVMDEGPLTQVRKIEFINANSFNHLELGNVITLRTNTPLRLSDIEDSITRLKAFYHGRGHLEMQIKNINDQLVEYNDKGTQANVRFDIVEGPQVIVSSIAIEGNTFTKDYVVLREIDFAIGDVLTPDKIEESQMRLNRMGIFTQVKVRTVEEGTMVSQRTIVISLRERDPGLFKIGIGADSERDLTLRQFTAISYSNLSGTARGISGRIEMGYNPTDVKYLTHRVTAGYLEPFLFNTRTRGRVNLTRQQLVTNHDSELTEITDSSRLDLLLERDLTRTTKLTWTLWSLDSVNTFLDRGTCIPGPTGNCPDGLARIALIGPTLDIDHRDNPFIPTRGSHTRWSLFYSDPQFGSSKDVNFVKSDITYTYLWNLGLPQLVWANQVRGGYISNLSGISGSRIPETHIFYLGGTSTIRGFSGSSAEERVPNAYEFPGEKVFVENDSHYYLIKSEFRFPLYESLGGVLFYDGGFMQVTGRTFEKPYRHSAGFGFRFNTPVGPVSLDMGFKLDRKKDRNEDPWRIHFFIGSF